MSVDLLNAAKDFFGDKVPTVSLVLQGGFSLFRKVALKNMSFDDKVAQVVDALLVQLKGSDEKLLMVVKDVVPVVLKEVFPSSEWFTKCFPFLKKGLPVVPSTPAAVVTSVASVTNVVPSVGSVTASVKDVVPVVSSHGCLPGAWASIFKVASKVEAKVEADVLSIRQPEPRLEPPVVPVEVVAVVSPVDVSPAVAPAPAPARVADAVPTASKSA